RVFTSTESIVDFGVGMMQLLAVGYIAFGVTQTLTGVMRGAGETVIPMWISIIVTVLVRMPIAYLWAYLTRSPAFPAGDPACLYGSLLVAWVLGGVMSVVFYLRGNWKRKCKWDDAEAFPAQTQKQEEGQSV
ncbi:MAG: MATE family efflux transporter, partial [Clostridia bacterium]